MAAEAATDTVAYDVSTREGFIRRAIETTDRRIPPRYQQAMASHPDITAWCGTFGPASPSLLILGLTGAGKTYQAYGAIRMLAARGIPLEWAAVTAPDLYALLRPHEGTDSETEFRKWAGSPLLLLDDLGAAKNSEFVEEVNYRLIGHRYNAMAPSLITSNVPPADLAKMLGDRVASRLREMCLFVPLKGGDRRKALR
jgi:DNA replication protein DnaC